MAPPTGVCVRVHTGTAGRAVDGHSRDRGGVRARAGAGQHRGGIDTGVHGIGGGAAGARFPHAGGDVDRAGNGGRAFPGDAGADVVIRP